MDKQLIRAYQSAKYIVLKNEYCESLKIKIGIKNSNVDTLLEHFDSELAVFITPENPFSRKLEDSENELRHKEFKSILKAHKLSYLLGYGSDEKEEWGREYSYLIFLNSKLLADDFANKFGQNAYVSLSENSPAELLLKDKNLYLIAESTL